METCSGECYWFAISQTESIRVESSPNDNQSRIALSRSAYAFQAVQAQLPGYFECRSLMKRSKLEDVLRYSPTPKNRSTVRRQYKKWRTQRGLPDRCDMPNCPYHTEPLEWLGKRLPLILDHINGNNLDGRPQESALSLSKLRIPTLNSRRGKPRPR